MDASARGQRIARARRRRGLSQAALAGLAGRSESWLSQVERGLRQVDSHSVLVSIVDILHVDLGELTGDEPGDPRVSQYASRIPRLNAFFVIISVPDQAADAPGVPCTAQLGA